MRSTLGKLLIGCGSLLIEAGEALAGRRWIHPALQTNGELDAAAGVEHVDAARRRPPV